MIINNLLVMKQLIKVNFSEDNLDSHIFPKRRTCKQIKIVLQTNLSLAWEEVCKQYLAWFDQVCKLKEK